MVISTITITLTKCNDVRFGDQGKTALYSMSILFLWANNHSDYQMRLPAQIFSGKKFQLQIMIHATIIIFFFFFACKIHFVSWFNRSRDCILQYQSQTAQMPSLGVINYDFCLINAVCRYQPSNLPLYFINTGLGERFMALVIEGC